MTKRIFVLVACILMAVSAPAEEFSVSVQDFIFTPAALQIQVGDTVTWTNKGGLHNVVAPGLFRCANGCDGEGGNGTPATNPWSFSVTFNTEAEIDYFCEVHELLGMVGSITVVAAGQLMINVSGSCPGEATLNISGGSPNQQAAVMFAQRLGNDPIPAGGCAGTPTGLASPQLLAIVQLDTTGQAMLTGILPAQACGVFLQAIDTSSCATSNTAQIPF